VIITAIPSTKAIAGNRLDSTATWPMVMLKLAETQRCRSPDTASEHSTIDIWIVFGDTGKVFGCDLDGGRWLNKIAT
jgi:hypothetical protein